MATTVRRFTVEDLDTIPEEHEGDRHELIDGELIVTPVPIIKHQIISSNIGYALERLVREHDLGWLFHPQTGIRLATDTLVIPDLVFGAKERSEIVGEKTIDGPPDLVVEILSPGTRRRDLGRKREVYARFGIREYWIVDPEARTVDVLALVGSAYESIPPLASGRIVSRVLPELVLIREMVFAGA